MKASGLWKVGVFCLGLYVSVHMLHVLAHECGHVINGIATGGSYGRIEISFLGWSHAYLAKYGEGRAVAWGGFLWETVFALVLFLSLWALRRPAVLWGLALAVGSFVAAGSYMLTGLVSGRGDSANLARMGIGKPTLIALGIVLILVGAALSTLLGPLLGVGRRKTTYWQTLVALGTPLIGLVAVVAIHSLIAHPVQRTFWLTSTGGGAVLALLCLTWAHFAAPWVDGAEMQSRHRPLTWRRAITGVCAGAVVLFGLGLCFPVTHHTLLAQAIRDGDVDKMTRLVKEHGHAPDPFGYGFTALHKAARHRNPAMTQRLIELGARVDATNMYGYTTLHMTAWGGSNAVEIAEQLLAAGADVNAKVQAGTPLHAAAAGKSTEMVTLLLSHGADPEAEDHCGRTPGDIARQRGAEEVVALLGELEVD